MPRTDVTTKIGVGGRVVIPADLRREIGADIGDEVILRLAGGEIHILTRSQAIQKAQALVRKSIPKGRSLVKELLRERRKEAERACLALGLARKNTVVTAEKLWSKLKLDVSVEVIRENAPTLPDSETQSGSSPRN